MLLILQIAINVVSFLHFDTTSTESDTKLDEKRDSFIWMFFFFFFSPRCARDYGSGNFSNSDISKCNLNMFLFNRDYMKYNYINVITLY